MAITAWSAKVLSSAICLSENGRPACAAPRSRPMGTPSRSIGTPAIAAEASVSRAALRSGETPSEVGLDVGDVDRPPARATAAARDGVRGHREPRLRDVEPLGAETVRERAPMEQLAVETQRRPRAAPSQSRTALSTMVSKTGWTSVGELAITRRISLVAVCCSSDSVTCAWPRDAVLLLQFREQPHVLDGDDRLVGERLEERDLLGREGMDLGPPIDEDDAQRRALAQQRCRQDCPGVDPACLDAGHGYPGTPPRPSRCPRRGSSAGRAQPVPLTVSRLTGMVSPIVR